MPARSFVKKAVRSVLFHAPALYDLLTSDVRYRLAYRVGLVHESDFRALPNLLPDRPLVVDVGGNIGQTVLSVKRVMPSARVVSFEPSPKPLVVLRRLQRRFPDLEVHPVGLSDGAGTACLYTPVYMGKIMSGLASLDRASAESWLNPASVFRFRPDRIALRCDDVSIMTLDDFHLAPDLIKIDVQGAEDRVICGGQETILRHRPVLLVESPSTRLYDLLQRMGYQPFEHRGRGRLAPSRRYASNQFFLSEQ